MVTKSLAEYSTTWTLLTRWRAAARCPASIVSVSRDLAVLGLGFRGLGFRV